MIQTRSIEEILVEANAMIARDDERISGMTFHGETYANHPVVRSRHNRAALVEEIARLQAENTKMRGILLI